MHHCKRQPLRTRCGQMMEERVVFGCGFRFRDLCEDKGGRKTGENDTHVCPRRANTTGERH